MGLFNKHKDKAEKSRTEVSNPTTTEPLPTSNTATANPTPQHNHSNSYHDSAYYSAGGSSNSEEPVIQKQQQQQLHNKPPGTTVTTTTTTTTVTTTVTTDGNTQTTTAPYNPSTDPPPTKTETTSLADDTSRTNTIGGSINTSSSNPNSSSTIPQAHNQPLQATTAKLTAVRPEVQRTVSPGRKPTPQELKNDSKFNLIPPTPQGSVTSVPASPTTTGGRIIPPRSERRSSPNSARNSFGNNGYVEPNAEFLNTGPESPGPPMRSEKRNSIDRGLNVAPLKTSHSPTNSGSRPVSSGGYGEQPRASYEAPPIVPPKDQTDTYFPGGRDETLRDSYNQQPQGYQPYQPYQPSSQNHVANSSEPMSSGGLSPDNRSHTPSYSRPGPTVVPNENPAVFDAPPTSAQAQEAALQQQQKPSHRQSITSALKGFQGASEVLRGSINSGIAKGTHDKAEQERMKAIREQGMKDYKASGLGDRMFGGRVGERSDGTRRLRKRSLSRNGVHGTEGPGGLEAVEERSIGDGRS